MSSKHKKLGQDAVTARTGWDTTRQASHGQPPHGTSVSAAGGADNPADRGHARVMRWSLSLGDSVALVAYIGWIVLMCGWGVAALHRWLAGPASGSQR